jgi:hypothetical protein
MRDLPPIDAVERKIAFAKDHPEVTFSVEPGLLHRAEWTDPETGQRESTPGYVWLGQLMDHLARKFGG